MSSQAAAGALFAGLIYLILGIVLCVSIHKNRKIIKDMQTRLASPGTMNAAVKTKLELDLKNVKKSQTNKIVLLCVFYVAPWVLLIAYAIYLYNSPSLSQASQAPPA